MFFCFVSRRRKREAKMIPEVLPEEIGGKVSDSPSFFILFCFVPLSNCSLQTYRVSVLLSGDLTT